MKTQLALTVNGEATDVAFDSYKTLLEVLREDLNLCGTKHGCELGECGACAVLLDGQPVLSCLVLGVECAGRDVVTVEGLVGGRTAASAAGRVRRSRRRAVRLLHAGVPRHRQGAARREPQPDARSDQGGAVRHSLPLHRLSADFRSRRERLRTGPSARPLAGSSPYRSDVEAESRSTRGAAR